MSETRLNNRRNWKAIAFPYDHFFPDDSKECQYCLTELQAEILRGIIEPLAWSTRWWSDTDTAINQDELTAFRDDIIRRLMMGCCGDETPIQYRYTGDGILQRSDDGGTTWTDAPEFDPRNNSVEFPPIEGEDGSDKRCSAATGAAALVKEQIGSNLTDEMTRYTLQQLITDWVQTMIQSSNPFEALLTVITNQIFALVISVIRPALTDPVYHQFACALYCTMADDGSFSDSQWQEARLKVESNITGVAGLFLGHLVYLLGMRGLTNLVRSAPAADGDCSDCECTDPCVIVVNTAPGMAVHLNVPPTDIDGDGNCVYIVTSELAFDSYQALYFGFGIGTFYDAAMCGYLLIDTKIITGGSGGTIAVIATRCGGSPEGLPHDACYAQMGFQSSPGDHVPFTVELHLRACP